MNTSTNLPWLSTNKRVRLEMEDLHALIDLIPFPTLALDRSQNTIGWANNLAAELTGYTRVELRGISLGALFPDADALRNGDDNERNVIYLKTHIGKLTEVSVQQVPLGEKSSWVLLRIEKNQDLERFQRQERQRSQMWPGLVSLCAAPLELELTNAISLAMQAAQSLLDAEMIAIYRVSGSEPSATKIASNLAQPSIPEVIPANDLARLKSPQVWGNRQSPLPDFHRILRNAGLRHVVSAPLGSSQAMTGLLIAASSHELPEYASEIILGIASTLCNILDNFAHLSNIEHRLSEVSTELTTSQAVWNGITDCAILLNNDLEILDFNRAAEHSLGYAFKEINGVPIDRLLISDSGLEYLFKAIRAGTPPAFSPVIRLYRRNGTYFQTMLRIMLIQHTDGLASTLILFQDITEQEQIRQRNEQLEQRALLGEVTASFAHEVRNPINNISTGLQVLELSLPEDDANQPNIRRLQQDCNRLTELIRSGLSFIKPLEYQLERINLNELLGDLLARWNNRLDREKIAHRFQPDSTYPYIEGDPRAVEQIFNNLFTNAVQAMKQDPPRGDDKLLAVRIRRVSQPGISDQIEISVSDTGNGVPENIREHIFEPFFTTKASGTGLGLAIVKRIVTAHKGSVHVSSIPGATVFTVRFPAI